MYSNESENYRGSELATTSGSMLPSPSEQEFRRNINEKNFYEAFAVVVKDLNRLKVTTIIEDEIEGGNAGFAEDLQGQPGKRMITAIDLIDGDITNVIGTRFIDNPDYAKLREEHIEQVLKGQDIVKGNLEVLRTAIRELIEIGQKLGQVSVKEDKP